jgi:hypothetical protein
MAADPEESSLTRMFSLTYRLDEPVAPTTYSIDEPYSRNLLRYIEKFTVTGRDI